VGVILNNHITKGHILENDDFLPCPSCGELSSIRIIQIRDLIDSYEAQNLADYEKMAGKYMSICSATIGGCGMSGPISDTKAMARELWNKRHVGAGIRISDD
jgi:hypothetical protein